MKQLIVRHDNLLFQLLHNIFVLIMHFYFLYRCTILYIILLQLDYLPNFGFQSLFFPIGMMLLVPFVIVIVIVLIIIIIIIVLLRFVDSLFTIILIVFVFFSFNSTVIICVFVYYPQSLLNNPFCFILP